MEGFQPLTPVKEIPRVSTLLSTKNRAWRWCMVCNAVTVLKTNYQYRSFSYGLQNAEELVQRLSRALDTDIRFSNCKHFNKSTYHFLMQWLSSTKIPHKFCLDIIHISRQQSPTTHSLLKLLDQQTRPSTGLLLWRSGWLVVSLLVKQAACPRVDREWKLIFHQNQSWKRWYHNSNTWWWTCLNLAKKVPTERSNLENNRFPKSGWQIHKYILPTSSLYPVSVIPSTEHCPAERSPKSVYLVLGLLAHVGKLSERRFVQHENLQSRTCLRPNANFYSAHPMNNGVERP